MSKELFIRIILWIVLILILAGLIFWFVWWVLWPRRTHGLSCEVAAEGYSLYYRPSYTRSRLALWDAETGTETVVSRRDPDLFLLQDGELYFIAGSKLFCLDTETGRVQKLTRLTRSKFAPDGNTLCVDSVPSGGSPYGDSKERMSIIGKEGDRLYLSREVPAGLAIASYNCGTGTFQKELFLQNVGAKDLKIKDGKLYIAVWGGGLFCFDFADWTVTRIWEDTLQWMEVGSQGLLFVSRGGLYVDTGETAEQLSSGYAFEKPAVYEDRVYFLHKNWIWEYSDETGETAQKIAAAGENGHIAGMAASEYGLFFVYYSGDVEFLAFQELQTEELSLESGAA